MTAPVVAMWGQADRGRGAGFGFAHLFYRDAATGLDEGHVSACGYDPTRHNGVTVEEVRFRPAPDDAPRCSRCEGLGMVGPRGEAISEDQATEAAL